MYLHPTLAPVRSRLAIPAPRPGEQVGFTELAQLARSVAGSDELWRAIVRHDPQAPWHERLLLTDDVEVALLGWAPGQGSAIHDHGDASGALTVVEGSLTEDWYTIGTTGRPHPVARRVLQRAATQTFTAGHVHRLANLGAQLATSVHVYAPPGAGIREYGAPIVDRALLAEAS